MPYVEEFLSYCRNTLTQPMYEAIGTAFVSVLRPDASAIFEASGKTPRESTKDVIIAYLATRNGGDSAAVEGAMFELTGDNRKVRVIDYIEERILMFIQSYGRTGRALRAGMDQTASTRVLNRQKSALATAMLSYEPGIAKVLLEDIGGLQYLCGGELYKVCSACGFTPDVNEVTDRKRLAEFTDNVLPTVIRHISKEYSSRQSGDWVVPKGMGNVLSDFRYDERGRKETMDFSKMRSLSDNMRDVPNPGLGDFNDEDHLPVAGAEGISSTYDIYYVSNVERLRELCKRFTNPTIYQSCSRFDGGYGCPWCLSISYHYNHYISKNGGPNSVYILLRKDWQNIALPSQKRYTNDDWTNFNLSCMACTIGKDGHLIDWCDRCDYNMTLDESYMRRLLQVNDLAKALPYRGNEGIKLDTIIKNNEIGVTESAGDETDWMEVASEADRQLSSKNVLPLSMRVCGEQFMDLERYNAASIRLRYDQFMVPMRNSGHDVAIYMRSSAEHDISRKNPAIFAIRTNGHYHLLGHKLIIDVGWLHGDSSCVVFTFTDNTKVAVRADTMEMVGMGSNLLQSGPQSRVGTQKDYCTVYDIDGAGHRIIFDRDLGDIIKYIPEDEDDNAGLPLGLLIYASSEDGGKIKCTEFGDSDCSGIERRSPDTWVVDYMTSGVVAGHSRNSEFIFTVGDRKMHTGYYAMAIDRDSQHGRVVKGILRNGNREVFTRDGTMYTETAN